MKEKIKVSEEGWFLFCPIWMAYADDDSPMPIPKHGLDWLFEVAMWVQQARNWVLSFWDDELTGFPFTIRPCEEREIEL